MAARRTDPSPGRRTAAAETARVDRGWEDLVAGAGAPEGDAVAHEPLPPRQPVASDQAALPPPVEPPAPDAGSDVAAHESPMVVVATTPGVPEAVAPPLVTATRAAATRAAAKRTASTRVAAARTATTRAAGARSTPAPTPPAASPTAADEGLPDPASQAGRMFSRLLVRMGNVERRLEAFESRLEDAQTFGPSDGDGPGRDGSAIPAAAQEELDADREYDRQMLTWLADRVEALTAELTEQSRQTDARAQAVDGAVQRNEALSAEIGRLQARLDDLAAASDDRREPVACPDHQLLAPLVDKLRQKAAATGEQALVLEARLAQLESLPSVMEDVAIHQFQRMAAELPPAPVDLEAFYKELDSVAEILSARDLAVARGLEQVESLEATVAGLSDDVVRLVDALAASRSAEEEARQRLRSLEQRLEVLESPEDQVERLHNALDRARGNAAGAATTEPSGAGRTTGIRVARGTASSGAPLSSAGETGPQPAQRSIQTLAADLDRIRRSLEVLADEVPATD